LSRTALCLLGVLLLSGGCTPSSRPTAPADTAHWSLTFSVIPSRPQTLDPAQFQVQVTGRSGSPVSGAAVSAQLAMPGMEMGRNVVVLRETQPPGTYIGTGRFTMAGGWQVTVSAVKGAAHQVKTFPIQTR